MAPVVAVEAFSAGILVRDAELWYFRKFIPWLEERHPPQ
jgi:hypothetical protein